jgi:hypothetical protein
MQARPREQISVFAEKQDVISAWTGGAGRIMHTQMDRVGLVLRTVARYPGRYSKTAERNVSGSYCLRSSWR